MPSLVPSMPGSMPGVRSGSCSCRPSPRNLTRTRFRASSSSSSSWAQSSKKSLACLCRATSKEDARMQMAVYVPPHPLVKHFMSVARNKDTPSAAFRSAMAELGRLLLYECAKDLLQTVDFEVETPCGVAEATFVDPSKPVTVVPVLRAGLVLVEQAHLVFPVSRTCHLGYVRDEETLEASMYLDRLPKQFTSDDLVVIADPMVATGGTAINAVRDVLDRGADIKNVRLVCAVCAPPALTKLGEEFPELIMYSAMIDPELNDKGYIVPGLGDAGDRAYGTE